MQDAPHDPIPSVDLPLWLESLILLVAKQLLAHYLPLLFRKDN